MCMGKRNLLLIDVHGEKESVDASDDLLKANRVLDAPDDILKANPVLEEAIQELQDQEDVNGRLALLQEGLHCE